MASKGDLYELEKVNIVFSLPENNQRELIQKRAEISSFFQKFNPIEMIEKITGRQFTIDKIIVMHKDILPAAGFKEPDIIEVDFNGSIQYIFTSVCHELTHLILRSEPPWYESEEIKQILNKNKDFRSKKFNYSFSYYIEQTIACLVQAACESRAGFRKLDYSVWKDTFSACSIEDSAKKMWDGWLDYLRNKEKYDKIDEWILVELKNGLK